MGNSALISGEYRPDIDGLRAFAVSFVILYHYFPNLLPSGFVGVDIFFVISGFLISGILIRQSEDKGVKFLDFYCRRIRRIFPALICVLVTVLIIGFFIITSFEYKRLGKHTFGASIFISNFMLLSESGYFDIETRKKILLHLWSLAIEEQFYIIFPILVFLISKIKRYRFIIILFAFLLSFIFDIINKSIVPENAFFSPGTRFWELLAGTLLFLLIFKHNNLSNNINNKNNRLISIKNKKLITNLYSIMGLICILISSIYFNTYYWPDYRTLLPILGASLIIYSGKDTIINKYLLSNKVIVYIGIISYPLYLWHWPFIAFTNIIKGNFYLSPKSILLNIIYIKCLFILLTILLSYITYKFIEIPIRFCSNQKKYVLKLVIIILSIGLFGRIIYLQDGYISRKSLENRKSIVFQLNTYPKNNDNAYKYIGKDVCGKINNCIFSGKKYDKTLAIIGDSHAFTAYPGFEENSDLYHFNTLLLSNYLPETEAWKVSRFNRDNNQENNNYNSIILDILLQKKDITVVLIILRGYAYLTGIENIERKDYQPVDYNKFKNELQNAINILVKNNKHVYILTSFPELPIQPDLIAFKPILNLNYKEYTLNRHSLTKYHIIYNILLSEIKNATIIDSASIICPKNICQAVSDTNLPYYTDDHHLSYAGSKFLADGILQNNLIDLNYFK
jgi:peptidoglycan/LPS O-acetylase OafA/YrhL